MAEAKIRLSVDGATMAKSDLDSVKASLSGIGSEAALLKTGLLALAGSLSVSGFIAWARAAIDAADAMNDMSQRTGIMVKDLAVFELASKQSGTTMESISRGVKGLSGVMSTHSEALKAAGITATDTNGAMIQLAEMFSKMPDGMEKTNLAVKVFGKSGMDLIPMLNMGAIGLGEAAEKANKYAIQMAIMAPLSDAFNDNMAEMAIHAKVVGMSILNNALPAMVEITRAMAEAAQKGGILSAVMLGVSTASANHKKGFNALYGIEDKNTGGASGSWADDGRKGLGDPRIVKPAPVYEMDAKTAATIKILQDALNGGGKGGATGGAAEKISEYTRMEEAIKKVTAAQEQELLNGGKLSASDKFRMEELQKITFAFATHKISQQERIRLIELTTVAAGKMLEVEKQAALVKANQAQYAEQVEFAKELADAEVALSKAREQGRAVLAEYSQAVDSDNAFTAFEISLVGQTEEAKKKAIALYRVEIELKKQLAAIDANAGFDGSQRAEAAAAANATAAIARAGVSSRAQLDAAEKTKSEQVAIWGQINDKAEAVFMDIARNGKGAFKGLEEELKNGLLKLLYDSTLKPFILKIGTEATGLDLTKLLGGDKSSGGGLLGFLGKLGESKAPSSSASDYKNGSDVQSDNAVASTADSLGKLGEAAGVANAGIIAQTIATVQMGISAVAAAAQMAVAFVIANPITSFFVAVGAGIAALFSFGKKEAPTVLNNLELFNKSLVGLPFLELSLSSDQASQGLRDVLYGLDNATPTMRKLAGETISLSVELLRASGDIAGARNLARNLDTRGMSEAEIKVYDYNRALRDQIEAQRAGAAAASAGAAAAREAEAAENQLAQARYSIAGKLNVLLGRTTQLEFDRATALAATSDAASIAMLKLTYQMEDLYTAVDASYAKLERSIAAEKKIADIRLKGATDLQNALKTAYDAISPSLDRATAQSQIAMYLALAKAGGVLPTAAMLKPALDVVAKPSADLFKTFEDYALDQARTAKDISDLSDYAGDQVSTEQQTIDRLDLQLENAKQALDVLKGVDNSITTAAAADAAFYASMLALSNAKASAPVYSYAPPAAVSGGSGGGYSGGGSAGSVGSGSAAGSASSTVGMDEDIVAAFNAYYGRNPDKAGYEHFSKLDLTGQAMMKAILQASIADKAGADYAYAVSHGFDPENPSAKYYHGKKKYADSALIDSSFARGINSVPYDMIAQIHEGERILPAADNRELFARLGNRDDGMALLVAEMRAMREQMNRLQEAGSQTAANTGKTMRIMEDLTVESAGTSLKVEVVA
jgi:hypothetical protein